MSTGLVVCFDGPDGVGKTTQLNLAADSLKSDGYKVFTVKAVGGMPLTDLLGQALMMNVDRPPEADLHIAMAGQYAISPEILKRRQAGEIVLIDRSPLSIIAYQVYADGLEKAKGEAATQELLDLLKPDLIISYAADRQTSKARLDERNGQSEVDYFESKPDDYHEKTSDGFKAAAEKFGAKTVDANAPIELVREATMQLIGQALQT